MSFDFVTPRWGVGWGEETADILRYGQTGRKYMQREENDVAIFHLFVSGDINVKLIKFNGKVSILHFLWKSKELMKDFQRVDEIYFLQQTLY